MANLFKIGLQAGTNNHTDYSSYVAKGGLKTTLEILSSNSSGRTADGNMHIELVENWDKYKVEVSFIPMPPAKVAEILGKVKQGMQNGHLYIDFYNPFTAQFETNVDVYVGSPSVTWNTLANGIQQTNTFTINFIER